MGGGDSAGSVPCSQEGTDQDVTGLHHALFVSEGGDGEGGWYFWEASVTMVNQIFFIGADHFRI